MIFGEIIVQDLSHWLSKNFPDKSENFDNIYLPWCVALHGAKKLQFSSGCNFEMTSFNQDLALKLLKNLEFLLKLWNFWAALKPNPD